MSDVSNFYVAGAAAMTSNRDDWETPQELFERLDGIHHFTVDVASTHDNAKCEHHYTRDEDGLLQDWAGEVVWCNPPYGRDSKRWIAKMADEAERGTKIVALLPARTDTAAFHDHIYKKPNVRVEFLRGRLKYERGGVAQQASPFPSMLVYFNC